jgi:hypothetical protein
MMGAKMISNLEGRALSRPATTKRGPPKVCISQYSTIPIFHYSNKTTGDDQ